MEKVKIGIIGFGYMGYYHYKWIVPSTEDFEVLAVYDADPSRLEAAQKLELKAYATLEDFLKDDGINTVIVSVPNDYHLPMVLAALNAGKNVICEKPVSMNANELEQMIECSKKNNKIFTVHQNRRNDGDFLMVKETIASNKLGKVFRIESRVDGSNGIPSDWRRVKQHGGGMLLDWGPHQIDQILTLVPSKLTSVYAHLYKVNYEVDDNDVIELNFENGMTALVETFTSAFIQYPRWHVLGDEGCLDIKELNGEGQIIRGVMKEVEWGPYLINYKGPLDHRKEPTSATRTMQPRPEETIERITVPAVSQNWQSFYYNFLEVLNGKAELAVKPSETLRTMKVIDLAFESSRTGKSISCNL